MSSRPQNGMKNKQQSMGAYPHPLVMYHQDPVTWDKYSLSGDEDVFHQGDDELSGTNLMVEVPYYPQEQSENSDRTNITFNPEMAAQYTNGNGRQQPGVPTYQQPPPEYYEESYPPPQYIEEMPAQYQAETQWREEVYDQPQYQQPAAPSYDPAEIEAIYQTQQEEIAAQQHEEEMARRYAATIQPSSTVQHSMEAQAEGQAPYIYQGGGRVPADIYSPVTGQPTRELSDYSIKGMFKIIFENEPCFLTESPERGLMPHGSPPEGCESIWVEMVEVATEGQNDQLPHDLIWFYLAHRDSFLASMKQQMRAQQQRTATAQVQQPQATAQQTVSYAPQPAPPSNGSRTVVVPTGPPRPIRGGTGTETTLSLMQKAPTTAQPSPTPALVQPTQNALIEKKRSYWPWVVLGVAGAGLVWYFWPRAEE